MNTYGLMDMMMPPQGRTWGPGAGAEYGTLERTRDQARQMALQEMALANRQKEAEYGRYTQSTPHMVDQLRLGNQRTQAEIPGVQAQSDILGLNRDVARATQPGTIASTNAKHITSYLESGIRNLELAAAQGSPMMTEAAYQDFRRGFPDQEMAKRMPPNFDPSVLPGLREAVKNSPAHVRAMEVEKEETNRAFGVADRNAAAAKARASVQWGARARQAEEQLIRGTPGQRLASAAVIEADYQGALQAGDAEAVARLEPLKRRADAVKYQAAIELAASLGVRLPPPLPGLPQPSATELIQQIQAMAQKGPQQPQPQPGQGGPIDFGALPK